MAQQDRAAPWTDIEDLELARTWGRLRGVRPGGLAGLDRCGTWKHVANLMASGRSDNSCRQRWKTIRYNPDINGAAVAAGKQSVAAGENFTTWLPESVANLSPITIGAPTLHAHNPTEHVHPVAGDLGHTKATSQPDLDIKHKRKKAEESAGIGRICCRGTKNCKGGDGKYHSPLCLETNPLVRTRKANGKSNRAANMTMPVESHAGTPSSKVLKSKGAQSRDPNPGPARSSGAVRGADDNATKCDICQETVRRKASILAVSDSQNSRHVARSWDCISSLVLCALSCELPVCGCYTGSSLQRVETVGCSTSLLRVCTSSS